MIRFDRLEALIKEQGRTKTYICGKAGKKRNYISDAQNGNGSISGEALAVFAAELGTTVEYLTGSSDEKHPGEDLSREEREYLDWYRNEATELEKEMVRRIVRGAGK